MHKAVDKVENLRQQGKFSTALTDYSTRKGEIPVNHDTFGLIRLLLFVLILGAFIGFCAIETYPAELFRTYLP